MDNNYEVGFGKPPKDTRFQPGVSGNKKGRPKGSKNTYTILKKILNQEIYVKENGQEIKIPKKGAMLTQLVNKGVKGEVKAISVLLPHLLISDMKEEEKYNILNTSNSNDLELLNIFISNIGGVSKGCK